MLLKSELSVKICFVIGSIFLQDFPLKVLPYSDHQEHHGGRGKRDLDAILACRSSHSHTRWCVSLNTNPQVGGHQEYDIEEGAHGLTATALWPCPEADYDSSSFYSIVEYHGAMDRSMDGTSGALVLTHKSALMHSQLGTHRKYCSFGHWLSSLFEPSHALSHWAI